ncbi:MAG: hypothetical protein IKU45_02415, partial [Clostridia bacterium]|nr:hypothetical protein [Clostridia bacterium]
MKRIKLIMTIFVIIFALIISGCSQKDIENPDQTDSSGDDNDDNSCQAANMSSPLDTYEWAGNVYEGELLDFDDETLKKDKKVKIKVRVTQTFKGDVLPGEIAEDYLSAFSIKTPLSRNTLYLFMTQGGDVTEKVEDPYSYFHIVPINGAREHLSELSYWENPTSVKTYEELMSQMLDLEWVERNYGYRFSGKIKGYEDKLDDRRNWTIEMNLSQFYVLADNVYIGEILEADFPWTKYNGKSKILIEGYDG